MDNKLKKLKKISIALVFLSICILIIYNIPYNNININNYIFISLVFIILGSIVTVLSIKFNIFIFEPFVLITVVYFSIFIFRPLMDIVNNDTLSSGVDVMGGCIKTTLIFTISYLMFIVGYCTKNNIKCKKLTKNKCNDRNIIKEIDKKKLLLASYVIWIICFGISLIYLILTGKSISYIFSLGNSGQMNSIESDIGFIGNISYSIILPWLYIFIHSKKYILKITISYLTLIIFLATGFRFPIVVIMLSPIVYYYCKKKKNPSLIIITSVLLGLLLMAGAVGFMRVGIRHGTGINWSEFNIEDILAVFDSDLTIYKPFYAIVENYPKNYQFYYGYEMILATLTMFIPRFIWPNKPITISATVITNIINLQASLNAQAYPSIASVYLEFGAIGCIVVMFIIGMICSALKKMYLEGDEFSLVLYAVILPAILQLLIRNHIPSLVYFIIFLCIPNIFIKKYAR